MSTSVFYNRPWRHVAVFLLASPVLLAAIPAFATEEAELASESRLAGITLPDETFRMSDEATVNQLMSPIQEVGKQFKNTIREREVFAWADPAKRAPKVKAEILGKLKNAGFNASDLGDPVKTEAGALRFFAARKDQPRKVLLGYWVDNKDALILSWASMDKDDPDNPAEPPAPKEPPAPADPEQPAASAPAKTSLLGEWGFTTISGTTYWDKGTGAYLGSGTGGSQTYTFLPNGRYKMFNYIKSRMYSWETQCLTWEEGTVAFSGNKVTITPTGGKYQVIDNQVASKNYTRPMTEEEVRKNVKQYYWHTENQNGKPVLIMGSAPDKSATYKRAEE